MILAIIITAVVALGLGSALTRWFYVKQLNMIVTAHKAEMGVANQLYTESWKAGADWQKRQQWVYEMLQEAA